MQMMTASQDSDQLPTVLASAQLQTANPRKAAVNMSFQNHPLSNMISTNYGGGGFHTAAQAAANFSNQAHNYNTGTAQLMSP